MEIIGKIKTFAKMMPAIEKDQLPNENEPISVKEVIKQGGLGKFLTPKEPINLNENELKFRCLCKIGNGEENYNKINREYKNQYKKGDKEAVIKVRERYPCFYFTNELWMIKALKGKPVKSGEKWNSGTVKRTTIMALVNSLVEKGFSKDRAFHVLSGRIGIKYERIRDLYYDTKRSLINEPFTVSSIPKSIDEYGPTDLVEYTFIFIKEGIEKSLIENIEEIKAIMEL